MKYLFMVLKEGILKPSSCQKAFPSFNTTRNCKNTKRVLENFCNNSNYFIKFRTIKLSVNSYISAIFYKMQGVSINGIYVDYSTQN